MKKIGMLVFIVMMMAVVTHKRKGLEVYQFGCE